MKIEELISIAESRLATLNQSMTTAVHLGNSEEIVRLEREVAETQASIATLKAIG